MKLDRIKGRTKYRKALAFLGALSVGATVLVGVLQVNTADAATVHKGCASTKLPQYFDDPKVGGPTAHYYVTYDASKNGQPDPDHANVCTKSDITAAGGDVSKSPKAPDGGGGGGGGGGAPAPAGKVYKGCGKTVDPWFFADANDNGVPSPHYYTSAPAADNSNAIECTQAQVDAAGGNPAWNNSQVSPVIGGGVNPQGTDTSEQRAQGGSRANPWPANVALKAFPNGCKSAPSAGTTVRVWKYLGGGDPSKAGWYECDCKQIKDAVPAGQCTNPFVAPGDANQGNDDKAKLVQDTALRGYKWAVANKVSIRKANYNDACPPGYTVKDSDRTTDITWSAPNNGNWCNLVRWDIFLAGALKVGPDNISAEMSRFTNGNIK